MKKQANLKPGTGITFKRGSLTYEGTILSQSSVGGFTTYRVAVDAPGGGPPVDEIDIHDGQILRVYE